ncbi:hypothetical protein EDD86DRAFT_245794 [Gorgonomyces haynaldii]|nr:hypothetical protein EDD86DRAFT_245794 [Gorgonomyces haynaldii]
MSFGFLFFQNLDTVCRHLNKLNPNLVNQKQQLMHQLFHTPADLWMCLEMDCMRIGCGRTKQKHAYQHGTDAGHHLSMKTTNLELWCYYVGSVDAHPVERYIVNYFAGLILSTQGLPQWVHQQWQLNDRRQHERKLHGISKQDTLLFIDIVWLRQWREFLAGNAMPPGPLDNTALVNNGALNPDISYYN